MAKLVGGKQKISSNNIVEKHKEVDQGRSC